MLDCGGKRIEQGYMNNTCNWAYILAAGIYLHWGCFYLICSVILVKSLL